MLNKRIRYCKKHPWQQMTLYNKKYACPECKRQINTRKTMDKNDGLTKCKAYAEILAWSEKHPIRSSNIIK